jgi:hypothetical protein
MVQEMAPVRRQLGALGKMARRKRIFARLREGASYEEIAGEESVSRERIWQIVSEVLQKRAFDSGAMDSQSNELSSWCDPTADSSDSSSAGSAPWVRTNISLSTFAIPRK